MWIAVAVAIGSATAAGLYFVLSADFDDPARNNLGVGLLTGVATGVAILAVEFALNQQSRAIERRRDDRQRDSLVEYATGELALALQRYAREIERMTYEVASSLAPQTALPGFRAGDPHLLWDAMRWISDIDRTDPLWYRNQRTLECVDVTLLVATHVAEFASVDDGIDERLSLPAYHAHNRISSTADILSQFQAPGRALQLAQAAGDLALVAETLDLEYAVGAGRRPQLPVRWPVDENGIVQLDFDSGGQPRNPEVKFVRELVAYIIDLLHNGFEESPTSSQRLIDAPSEADFVRRRWSSLVGEVDETVVLWDALDDDSSWLRQALRYASERGQWSWGVPRR